MRDLAEIARHGHVTRARVTQIMNLLHLAPGSQEAILFLPRVEYGRDPLSERDLRTIAAFVHDRVVQAVVVVRRHGPPAWAGSCPHRATPLSARR